MSKNILIIKTSPRKGGNSDTLADEFAKGAIISGNTVGTVSVVGKTINFCRGCLICHKNHKCVINDDAVSIAEKALQGWVDCFEKSTLKGVVFAGGVNEKGEIAGHKALKESFEMGKKI